MATTTMKRSTISTSPVQHSKRPLPRDCDDKENPQNEGGQSTPRSKRVALMDTSNVTASQIVPAWKSTAKSPNALTKRSSLSSNSSDWDVTGKYRLKCTSHYCVDASNYSLEIRYENGPFSQLYATFAFGNLRGIMRMCSAGSMVVDSSTWSREPMLLADFEAACRLSKGCKPSPKFKKWLMRWRGHDHEDLTGGETRAQGQFFFEEDSTASSRDFQGIRITFAMIHKGKHLVFEGEKTRGLELEFTGSWSLQREWRARFDPAWESAKIIEDSQPRTPQTIPIGGIIKARNILDLDPTLTPAPTPSEIETLPSWAFDVTGKWEITAPEIATILELPSTAFMSMTIFLANSPQQPGIGRQLWARFDFGGVVRGIIRFCPSRPVGRRQHQKSTAFEKACYLDYGVWAGPAPNGQGKWNIRWRGRYPKTGEKANMDDKTQSDVEFYKSAGGQLCMSGSMVCEKTLALFDGTKLEDVGAPEPNNQTIASLWNYFVPLGVECHSDSDDLEDEEENFIPKPISTISAPLIPTVSSSSSAQPASRRAPFSWDVEGHYKINYSDNYPRLDTSGFSLKLFYSDARDDMSCQMYATFTFDTLKGIMRMCPASAGSILPLEKFEAACNLDTQCRPSARNSDWRMRYRARDGGLRLGKLVGGEVDVQMEFTFQHKASFSTPTFTAIEIGFAFLYNDIRYDFTASKEANLRPDFLVSPRDMELEWDKLYDYDWKNVVIPYADSGPSTSKAAVKSTSGPTSKPSSSLSNFQGVYKIKATYYNARRGGGGEAVDTAGFKMKVFYYNLSSPCQLYATFSFGSLKGVMRMCPANSSHTSREEFDRACNLAPETQPSPTNRNWRMRWRGKNRGMRGDELVGEEMGITDSIVFYPFSQSSSPELMFMMTYNDKSFTFRATKVEDLKGESADAPPKLVQQWAALYNPDWDATSDSEPEPVLRRNRKQTAPRKNPSPVVSYHQMAGMQATAGPSAVPSPALPSTGKHVEEMPPWAWALRGYWTISPGPLLKHLGVDEKKTMLKFNMSNNPLHFNVLRQIWATLYLENALHAVMRFCPVLPEGEEPRSLPSFESACVLPSGCWPGQAPEGVQKWWMRWRGTSAPGQTRCLNADQDQTQFTFEKADNGMIKMRGVLVIDNVPLSFEALRTVGEDPHSSDTGLKKDWDRYKPPVVKASKEPLLYYYG